MRWETRSVEGKLKAQGWCQSRGTGRGYRKDVHNYHGWWMKKKQCVWGGHVGRGGLYLPAASPHRNSCLSDYNRRRCTEGTSDNLGLGGGVITISVTVFTTLYKKKLFTNHVTHMCKIQGSRATYRPSSHSVWSLWTCTGVVTPVQSSIFNQPFKENFIANVNSCYLLLR